MPPFPGEETLATVYVDLHSYFTAPSPRPALHRFDKASYFYVYYNSTRQTSRIEAAINPGTPDQTAFNGFLDGVKVINSHRFPTRVTLVVDGDNAAATSPSSPRSGRDPDEWRLASSDPRDPGTSKYRIHTIDAYFWNQGDSKLIMDIFKRLLQPRQLDIDDDAHEESDHHDMVSPVVQNLENVAISDPAYKQQQHDSPSIQHTHPVQLPPAPPPPATSQAPPHSQAASASPISVTASVGGRPSTKDPQPATDYTPLAYNPAAPAAPEPIAHREDTPPPVDASDGTGLAAAARHDNPYVPQQPPQAFVGSQAAPPSAYGHYGAAPQPSFGPHASTTSPVPSFGPQATATVSQSFGPHAASTPLQTSPRASVSTNFGPPPTSAAGSDSSRHPSISTAAQTYAPHGQDPNAHIFGQQNVQTPGTQFYQSINGLPHKPLQHVQPQYPDYLAAGSQAPAPAPPLGGYSSYNYGQPQQPQPAAGTYDIHSQVYRPTEAEHHSHHHKPPKSSGSQPKPSHTEKIEKGVGKWIKKIEKNFG
ncbi:uncharacterized protein Z519_04549 [Cladophialophora bantiana CBS 173.52]|uniref:Unplaced genomic scaffold supercont1.6, whole genome shotgun sequence n=1 Tax=Cladophialophora bantiana (strain ATCC 10958 / CBS 173.52 / CDC B-1940 / NIH 8579) TaxID=1442370 RepID=A0A0D2HMK7_CLAB1|nr:uncharacterized protein Z519_04549 [Cladophialophora bantiana CBS 173.52]KIW94573.1 hypothetical protein Z519_04549 [Cladophialophora bantiana CBS 173.52]